MILGSYKIFKNNECVAEKENLVTTVGKDILLKFLSSSISNWADALAVGIGTTAATASDSSLNFEVARNVILLKSPNILTSTATYASGTNDTFSFTVNMPTSGSSGSFGGGTIGTVTTSSGVNTAKVTGLTSTAGMVVGSRITATTVSAGAFGADTIISEVIGPTSIIIKNTSSITAGTISGIAASYIVPGMAVSGTGINKDSVITNVASTQTTVTITISHSYSGVSGTLTFTQRKIILKTSLDPQLVTTVNEIGVFSNNTSTASGTYSTDIITKFDEGVTVNNPRWTNGTNVSTSYVAAYSLGVSNTSTMLGGSLSSPQRPGTANLVDFSRYSSSDTIKLAVYNNTASAQTSAITITFYDTQNDLSYGAGSMTWTIPSQSYPVGLTVVSTQISNLYLANNFNNKVSAMLLSTNGNLVFDAIKVDRFLGVNPVEGLVSRTVLSSPISKTAGDSLEIQYELVLGL